MKLEYSSIKDNSRLIVTNFNCAPSKTILTDNGLFKILWTKSAPATIIVDGYRMELKQNQVVFCTSLNKLEIEEEADMISVVFNREFYCIREHDEEVSCNGLLFFGSSLPPVISLCEKDVKSFDMLFYFFQEEFETKDHIQGEMLRTLLKRLLIKSSRLIKKDLTTPTLASAQIDLIRKYNLLVEEHFRVKHQVADYAELLFKSPKTLSNLFKKFGNRSPLKIINERIILEAKRLLQFSDKTAEEIAFELGYKEAAHFSKFFKNQVGEPPVEFKKNTYQNLSTQR